MTPGWKTSEFWVTVANKVLGLLVALGVISSSDSDAYTKGISGAVGGVFIIASTYMTAYYTGRRTALKKAEETK